MVSDIQMAGMDGRELCRTARARYPDDQLPDLRDDLDDGLRRARMGARTGECRFSREALSPRQLVARLATHFAQARRPARRTPMQPDVLNGLDYTRYARWLRRITGVEHDFAVCERRAACWPGRRMAEATSRPGLAPSVRAASPGRAPATACRLRMPTGLPCSTCRSTPRPACSATSRCASPASADAPLAWDALAETFEDIAGRHRRRSRRQARTRQHGAGAVRALRRAAPGVCDRQAGAATGTGRRPVPAPAAKLGRAHGRRRRRLRETGRKPVRARDEPVGADP